MKTMTRIQSVETRGSSTVATLLGGKAAGTTDPNLGRKLLDLHQRDPENCLCELTLEDRGGKLHITGVEYVEAPPELGGPEEADTAPVQDPPEKGSSSTGASASESTDAESTPPAYTLDDLLALADRVAVLERFCFPNGLPS